MKELRRFQSLPGGLLVLVLFSVVTTSTYSQVVVSRLGSLGGSSLIAFDLNNAGQAAGNAFTAGNQAQHAVLFQNGAAVDLGTLGGISATAVALNSHGHAVGSSSTAGNVATHAFLFDGSAMLDLGTLGGTVSFATDVNDSGVVVGSSYLAGDLSQQGFRFSGGVLHGLGTLGGSYSSASAVNNLGSVVGESSLAGEVEVHAYLHNGTTMMDLGTLGGTYSSALQINNSGWVAGYSTLPSDFDQHAFLFDGVSLIDLGTLGGNYSIAYEVNDNGWVIGDATTPMDAEYHGFVYGAGVMVDLGTLGGSYSSAWDLNSAGQVVGEAENASSQLRAFLWENGVMTDLNSLLPPDSGWELFSAQFINDLGDIVGVGLFQGQFDYFLLSLAQGQPANQPPVAHAGADHVAECAGDLTPVAMDGSGSSDPDGDALVYTWTVAGSVVGSGPAPAVVLPAGVHAVTLTVTDPHGESSQDTLMVHVQDTTAPAVGCPVVPTVEVGEGCVGVVPDLLAGVVATDGCASSAALVLSQVPAPGTALGVGVHVVTVTVTDPSGNPGVCMVELEVVDTQAPVIAEMVATPEAVSPPNNKMVQVCLEVAASDNCDPAPVSRIVEVLKNGGAAGADALLTGPLCAEVRALAPNGSTVTVYTLVVECVDSSGNSSTASLDVRVENVRGKKPADKPAPPRKPVNPGAQKPAPPASKGAKGR